MFKNRTLNCFEARERLDSLYDRVIPDDLPPYISLNDPVVAIVPISPYPAVSFRTDLWMRSFESYPAFGNFILVSDPVSLTRLSSSDTVVSGFGSFRRNRYCVHFDASEIYSFSAVAEKNGFLSVGSIRSRRDFFISDASFFYRPTLCQVDELLSLPDSKR